ncbi:MAG: SHOCT domain-containing protein [Candidatus Rokubacteria bacterium]|nr:SHOCT domain-containing protein [Candidatus Rokubacteria bacterium]
MGGGANMMGWGGGPGLAGGLLMLLFWGVLIVAAVVGVRWLWDQSRPAAGHGREESSLEILKRRYARGEIGREEFELKKRDLE